MSNDYQKVKQIFVAACELDPAVRGAFIEQACGDDAELKREVESLLGHLRTDSIVTEGSSTAMFGQAGPAVDPLPQNIGPYRIVLEISRGGQGVVYLGVREDDLFTRRAAIKVLQPGMSTRDMLQRFDREAKLLAGMNHPNIARFYDAGQTADGRPYFALEYIEGLPITEYCDKFRLGISERLQLFRAVCAAVHHAHQNLVVHRDLKPGNIVVSKDGTPKLLDFGIAKMLNPTLSATTDDPTILPIGPMTPHYASPEQVRGDPLTTATDIYSLGVLLYELLTGHRPYHIGSRVQAEIERVICETEPDKPSTVINRTETPTAGKAPTRTQVTPESISRARESEPTRLRKRLAGDLDNIVLMAMRKEPQRRYESAQAFSEDIDHHLRALPVKAQKDTLGYRMRKFTQRNRAAVTAAAAVLLILVIGVVATSWGWRRAATAEASLRAQVEYLHEQSASLTDAYRAVWQLEGSIEARQEIARTLRDAVELLRKDVPNDPALLRQLADVYDMLGSVQGGFRSDNLGNRAQAQDDYRRALELRRRAEQTLPDDALLQGEIAVSHVYLGDLFRIEDQLDEATSEYELARAAVTRGLDRDPRSEQLRRTRSVVEVGFGDCASRADRFDEAERIYRAELDVREDLLGTATDRERARADLAVVLRKLGSALSRKESPDFAESLEHTGRALAIREELARTFPRSGKYRRDVAMTNLEHALIHLRRQDADGPIDDALSAASYLDAYLKWELQHADREPNDARIATSAANTAYRTIVWFLIDQRQVSDPATLQLVASCDWGAGRAARAADRIELAMEHLTADDAVLRAQLETDLERYRAALQ